MLRGSTALVTLALAAAVGVTMLSGPEPAITSAQAQDVSLSVQFRTALEPHGRWSKHQRWGDVWIPAKRDREWRPYTVGRWTYTDRWGWYWVSDEDFGWVTYHYGRWVRDADSGWVWIPGNEWGPAWVQWRRGEAHAGWAPMPPREVVYEYDDDPDYWVFVRVNDIVAPNIVRVVVPPRERVVYIRETVIVNRTIIVDRGPRIAVNPGIEPRIIAARIGRPIRVTNVQPVVVAGTVGVQGSITIRTDQREKGRERVRARVTESKETIEPAKDVPPPTALKKGEEGRFGERPPEAAKEQAQRQQQQQPDAAKGQPDAAKGKGDDAAKGKGDDAAKSKADDAAKSKTDDAAKSKSDDAAKSKMDDTAKSKSDDAAKAKSDAAMKSKADDAAKSKSDDAAKSKMDDAAKSKADDKGAATKSEPKGETKSEPKGETKSSAEPKQAAPKSAPEPKQAEPKAQPKQAEPKSSPEPKSEPKSSPEPKSDAKSSPEPKSAPAAKGGGEKGDDEKGKAK